MADKPKITEGQARKNLFASLCVHLSEWTGEAAVFLDPSLGDDDEDEDSDERPSPKPRWMDFLNG